MISSVEYKSSRERKSEMPGTGQAWWLTGAEGIGVINRNLEGDRECTVEPNKSEINRGKSGGREETD